MPQIKAHTELEKTIHTKLLSVLKVTTTAAQKLIEDTGRHIIKEGSNGNILKFTEDIVDNLHSTCLSSIKTPVELSEQAAWLVLVQTFIPEIRLQDQGH